VTKDELAGSGRGAKCERCGSHTSRGADEDGATIDKCWACGHEKLVAPPENPAAGHALERVRAPASGEHWTAKVRSELKRALGLIAAADRERAMLVAEAERTQAALIAYGLADVPELPWKNPLVKRAKVQREYPSCARCGRQFTAGPQYETLVDGAKVCRGKVPCDLRLAAR
jgi:predicted  nucleic acid-binding Zn-ribbon protein